MSQTAEKKLTLNDVVDIYTVVTAFGMIGKNGKPLDVSFATQDHNPAKRYGLKIIMFGAGGRPVRLFLREEVLALAIIFDEDEMGVKKLRWGDHDGCKADFVEKMSEIADPEFLKGHLLSFPTGRAAKLQAAINDLPTYPDFEIYPTDTYLTAIEMMETPPPGRELPYSKQGLYDASALYDDVADENGKRKLRYVIVNNQRFWIPMNGKE